MKKILLIVAACMLFITPALAQDALKEVARATFTTGIENREPVEPITEYFPVEGGIIYFFTELKNMHDGTAYHVWHRNGEEIYRFSANIGGPRWRTNSSMKSENFKTGDEVTVEVLGSDGNVYESLNLKIR